MPYLEEEGREQHQHQRQLEVLGSSMNPKTLSPKYLCPTPEPPALCRYLGRDACGHQQHQHKVEGLHS
jgi:hypothetical protein